MDAPDWAQEQPSPPDWAVDNNTPDSGGIRLPSASPPSNQASPQLTQAAATAAQPDTSQHPGLWEGVKRGAQQFDVGSRQLSADLLKSVGVPVDPNAEQALDQGATTLKKQGEGTGVSGTVGEMLGDPTSYIPMGEVGTGAKAIGKSMGKLGLIGGASGATAPSEDDQGLGQRGINSLESGALSGAMGPVAQYAGKGVGAAGQWASNKSGFSQLLSNIGERLGAKPTGTDLYEMAQQANLPTKGKSAEQIYGDLKNWYGDNVDKAAAKVGGGFDPLEGMADISQSYNAARQKSNELYGAARMQGEGKEVDANGLQDQLQATVGQLAGKQFRTQSEDAALSRLQDIQNNLGWAPRARTATVETGTTQPIQNTEEQNKVADIIGQLSQKDERSPMEDAALDFLQNKQKKMGQDANPTQTTTYQPINKIGFNDLVDLKQALNEGFDSSNFAGKGDRPIAKLYGNVKDALGRAAEQDKDPVTGASPFGDALYAADRHYSDDLAPTYRNDTLKKFWTADDDIDYKTSQGWSRRAPNVDTTGRADKMLDNIKTPSDLQAVTQAMSPEQAGNLSATWFKNTMDKAGLDGDQIDQHYDTLKYALQGNPQASQLLDNVKTGVDAMNARGIGDKARFFDQNNPDIMKNAVMGAVALKAGRPLYALKSLLNVLDKKSGTAVQKRIKGFAGEINAGNPSNQLLTPLVDGLANQAGKQTAIDLGEGQNQPNAQRTAGSPYARGGRVNKYGKCVGLLRG